MLKIRLQRIGKKNDPSYRIAWVEHTTSPHGKFIELLGSYSPKMKVKKFDKERIEYWLTKGAQASPTVHNLLVDEKIINKEKVRAWKAKKKISEVPPAGGIPTEVGKEQVIPEAAKAEEPKIEAVPEVARTEEQKVEEPKQEPIKVEEIKPVEELKLQEIPNIDTQERKE